MIKGLDVFRRHFEHYTDRYVLIGGVAATLAMEEAGLDFRATKDIDLVLVVEAMDVEFGQHFWQFVMDGGYQVRERSEGKPHFYRFQKPMNLSFPVMLELFSRMPDGLVLSQVWLGGDVLAVPARNTSRTCPACGHVSADNRQTQAKFACVDCGYENNADMVGAINVLERGHRLLACGELAQSGRSVKQKPAEGIRKSSREPVGIPFLSFRNLAASSLSSVGSPLRA